MKTTILKKLFFAFMLTATFSLGSCKDNNQAEGNIVSEPSQVDNYPEETQQAADTTSRAEEDSIIDAPSP